jgi:cell division protein FtsN
MASSRGRQAVRHERQPLPFWVGLVVGFFFGIVVASVFIYRDYQLERQRAAEAAAPRTQPALTPSTPAPRALPPALVQPVAPRNDVLPAPAPGPTPTPAPDNVAAAPAPAASTTPPAAPAGRSLVAGSLRSQAEAEQRKAELALMGVSSRVIAATINGERRYRVVIGPFGSERELEAMRAQLKSSGVDSFVSGN